MATPSSDRLAVLIDADNAQASVAELLLAEVSRYGTATIKRAYGDWTTPNLRGWKDILHRLAVQPIQQFRHTSGKNATDSALIIDAMDLLHSGLVDGFCLVSSDSDFTRLATRIRESGKAVYGFGESKTPQPFVSACDKFVFTEILRPEPPAKGLTEASGLPPLDQILIPRWKPRRPKMASRRWQRSAVTSPRRIQHLTPAITVSRSSANSFASSRSSKRKKWLLQMDRPVSTCSCARSRGSITAHALVAA